MKRTNLFSAGTRYLLTIAFVAFLSSCANQKVTTSTPKIVDATPIKTQSEHVLTAQQIVAQAASLSPRDAISSFIIAGELYLEESNPQQALWLAVQSKSLATSPQQQYQFALIESRALLLLAQFSRAYNALEQTKTLATKHNITPVLSYYQTLARVQKMRSHPIASLDAELRAFNLNSEASSDDINNIWQALTQLSQWQHQQLLKTSPPKIKGWSKLLTFANKYGADSTRFKRYLTQWQREFSTHPAQQVAAQLQTEELALLAIENIAVLIPLSGVQERAGKVVQQGIFAAYEHEPDIAIHFIDSNELDMSTLAERFIELKIDYVIGPLLKSNVRSYLAQTELKIPTLLLNLPSGINLLPHQVAISMRPEDEAIQAATTLSRQQYKHPMILSHQDKTSRRIANTFSQQWQHLTGEMPDTLYFNNDAKMQDQLKSSLGVDLSQQRTKDLNARIRYSIKHEYRNRRDIDMIYIVGSPLETKLLKPYIDVNTSPFSDIIPVFASSRSHSAKNDKSDNRDLSGLVFTSIPWQLPSKQQNKVLAAQARKIWPNRSDSLQTIFAMGYDSLSLISKISAMQNKTYIRHYGQTGVLQLDTDNILKRSLVWGRYSRNKVQEIAMD